MDSISYVKISNERQKKYRIITKRVNKDGELYVTKEALYKNGVQHIKAMKNNYERLHEQYQAMGFDMVKCDLQNDSLISFPVIAGKNLENVFEELLETGQETAVLKWIGDISNAICQSKNVVSFKTSEEFERIFGVQKFVTEKKAFMISNLDLIFSNFILQNNNLVIIDYEWVFECQIPLDYILFRAILLSPSIQKMSPDSQKEAYRLAGVLEEDKNIFYSMEQNFQNYVRGDCVSLEHMHKCLNYHCKPLRLIDGNKLFNDYEVMFDNKCVCSSHTLEGDITINLNDIPQDVQTIRVNLNHYNGVYKIIKMAGYCQNKEENVNIIESNSTLTIVDDYYYEEPPYILLENRNYEKVIVTYKVLDKDNPMMSMLVRALIHEHEAEAKVHEAETQIEILTDEIRQIHESKTWKIGEKIAKITRRN